MTISVSRRLNMLFNNIMGSTSEARTAYPSAGPKCSPSLSGVRNSRPLDVYVMFVDHCLYCNLFRLVIVLSVFWSTCTSSGFQTFPPLAAFHHNVCTNPGEGYVIHLCVRCTNIASFCHDSIECWLFRRFGMFCFPFNFFKTLLFSLILIICVTQYLISCFPV